MGLVGWIHSKMILGYSVENSSSPKVIRKLLEKAYIKHKNKDPVTLVTDGDTEKVKPNT